MPRPHHDPELWNDDVEFLMQESDSALGLHAASLEPSGSIPAEELVERKIAAVFRANGGRLGNARSNGAVQRYRRVITIWRRVRLQHRDVLVAYYSTAGTLPTNHSLLGRVAIVALWRFGDDEKLRKALRLGKREDCEPFAHRAEKLVRAAHREWNRAALEAAGNWVEGKRDEN